MIMSLFISWGTSRRLTNDILSPRDGTRDYWPAGCHHGQ
jgi:hypothetical protein